MMTSGVETVETGESGESAEAVETVVCADPLVVWRGLHTSC